MWGLQIEVFEKMLTGSLISLPAVFRLLANSAHLFFSLVYTDREPGTG